MSRTALILVDIQNDYFDGGLWPVHQMEMVAEKAALLLEHARKEGMDVVHIHHEIPNENAPFFRPGSEGAKIHASVAPVEGEAVILKHRPNSFQGTDLNQELKDAGVTDVVICGAMSQMCIDATARAAADFGYKVTVVENACGAKEQVFNGRVIEAEQVHAAFMAPLAMSYGSVVTAEDYLG